MAIIAEGTFLSGRIYHTVHAYLDLRAFQNAWQTLLPCLGILHPDPLHEEVPNSETSMLWILCSLGWT